MFKIVLATVFCICLSSLLVSSAAIESPEELSAAKNSSLTRNKRNLCKLKLFAPLNPLKNEPNHFLSLLDWPYTDYYPYGYYPYQYYNWYNVYNSHFAVAACSGPYACPTACPGVCGVWSSLGACRCDSCPYGLF